MILRMAVVAVLASSAFAGVAQAGGDPPKPMTLVPAGKSACEALTLTDPKSACKVVSSEPIAGFGKAQLLSAGIIKKGMTFALAIDVGGKTYVTDPAYAQSDCGMGGKCDNPVSAVPKMRTIAKKHASLEVQLKMSHDTDAGSTKFTKAWFAVCKQTPSGVPACSYRQYGAPGAGCTASLTDAGTLTHACAETEEFGN